MRNVRRTSRARQLLYREYLATQLQSGCVDCGTSDLRVLEFDHVRGEKVASIGQLMRGASLQKIKAEVAKCEVRCRNCHAIVTLERMGGTWHDRFLPRASSNSSGESRVVARR